VPSTPVFPAPALLLGLGLVVGLALGAAAAVLRSRTDTRLYGEDDVRTAWGSGADELVVHSGGDRRRRRRRTAGGPVAMLARQLEPLDEGGRVRAVLLPVSPDQPGTAQHLVAGLTTELADRGTAVVAPAPSGTAPALPSPAGVHLTVGSALAPAREWRRLARATDGTVLVVTAGQTDAADLREARAVLAAAGAGVFSVVVLPPARPGRTAAGEAAAAGPVRPGVPAGDRVAARS
jgi:hypothetical protein